MNPPEMNEQRSASHWPRWIDGLNIVIMAILVFKTYSALWAPQMVYKALDPAARGAETVLSELAGRNMAMMLISLLALISRRPGLMSAVVLMGLVRETFDAFLAWKFSPPDQPGVLMALSFVPFLAAYVFALRILWPRHDSPR